MKKTLEKLSQEKFVIANTEASSVKGGWEPAGPKSSWREVETYGPNCTVTCDQELSDICIGY